MPQKVVRRAVAATLKPATAATDNGASDVTMMIEEPSPADTDALSSDVVDDRASIQTDDLTILVVDNDLGFSQFVLDTARKVGFKGLITPSGAAAIALAGEYQPRAIVLDISLPDIDGWRVLERLKRDLSVRHIPVYVCSTVDHPEQGLKLGAQGILQKPIQTAEALEHFLDGVRGFVDRAERKVVIVGSEEVECNEVRRQLSWPQVRVEWFDGGAEALESIRETPADCIVLTPDPADMSLANLAEQFVSSTPESCPKFLFVDPATAVEQMQRLSRFAQEFGLRLIDSPQHLVDEAATALCQSFNKLPEDRQEMIGKLWDSEIASVLQEKKVLIVDDDIRNIFALTSVLERYDMVTVSAETGRDAINLLQAAPDVDIVLMDIMMPEMDGIDTTRAIRQIPKFKNLPIVAVTAKAMKGDREKCIEAGAWDYLSKPVDPEHMLSVLRAWLTT